MNCLEVALVLRQDDGVWGGMGEAERRAFRDFLAFEGYMGEVPENLEFWASLNSYYRHIEKIRMSRLA